MKPLLPFDSYAAIFAVSGIGRILTYAFFAGLAFWIFWVLGKKTFASRRIIEKFPSESQYWFEIKSSLTTIAIWGLMTLPQAYAIRHGSTQLYDGVASRGLPYYFFSIILFIVIHDTYFYWTHRLMHHPRLFKLFHAGHHRSTNPSPFAIFSFQPAEAVVQFAVTYIFVFLVPAHPSVLILWSVWLLVWNVVGHLGYEIFPQNWARHPVLGLTNTTTHHAMHHRYVTKNFGLYFTWWDRIGNTEHARYHEVFDGIHAGEKL